MKDSTIDNCKSPQYVQERKKNIAFIKQTEGSTKKDFSIYTHISSKIFSKANSISDLVTEVKR